MTEYGCSRICLAVIQRDEKELKRLLGIKTMLIHSGQGYPPLYFAIGWPAGMRMLLLAGANPSEAIFLAVVSNDLEAVTILFEFGATTFLTLDLLTCEENRGFMPTYYNYKSLLYVALQRRVFRKFLNNDEPYNEDAILHIIISTMARYHRQLTYLAKDHLATPQLKKLGWKDPSNINEFHNKTAVAVFKKLKSTGVETPENLWPGWWEDIYRYKDMTRDEAEALFQAGFTDISEVSDEWEEPPLLDCAICRFPMVLWLLEHGAQTQFYTHNNITIVHRLASRLGYLCDPEQMQPSITKLQEDISQPKLWNLCAPLFSSVPKDNCRCFCSTGGYTPIQSLMSEARARPYFKMSCFRAARKMWEFKQFLFSSWVASCPQNLDVHQEYTANLCRIELFDRLGMRHTCCKFGWYYSTRSSYSMSLITQAEVDEFREEDRFSNMRLSRLMSIYTNPSENFSDRFEEFWETWWKVLESIVPPEAFCAKTGTRTYNDDWPPIPGEDAETVEINIQEIYDHVVESMS